MSELGDLLRAGREKKGVSLSEVEEATRIRRRHLEALESGDDTNLPASVYVRGFLRNYALYLGLSPQDVLALYGHKEEPEAAPVPVQEAVHPVHIPARFTRVQFALAMIFIGLIALLFLIYNQYGQYPSAPASVPSPSPTPVATPVETATPPPQPTLLPTFTPTPTPIPDVQVQVLITERSWLRMTVDGEMVLEGTLEAGETRTWIGKEKVTMLCGNAAGTSVTVNGVRKGPLGSPGEVVELTWTKP